MVITYPKVLNEQANAAEKKMYQVLSSGLGDFCVCYHNYNVVEKQTDFMVIVPGEGIVIIEVKAWSGKNLRVEDKETIYFKKYDGEEERYGSPLSQAETYCYKWRDKIKDELGLKIKVVPVVCYPFMTEADFMENRLDIVSDREITILKDDLENINEFKFMFKHKYGIYQSKGLDVFDQETYIKVRRLKETDDEIAQSLNMSERKKIRLFREKRYSRLVYLPEDIENQVFQERLEQYYNDWLVGTKIILILGNEQQKKSVMTYFDEKLKEELDYLCHYPQFCFYNEKDKRYQSRIFNFEIYTGQLPEAIGAFEIIDGEEKEGKKAELMVIDKHTDFNFRQYEIEHTKQDKNILVKAGAGTGKTYSMVSRIGFLYYRNNYVPEDLVKRIIMITFTNEAANNMKVRLKEYFTNMAILTESVEYLKVMENVSRMKISTLHSLSKKIIGQYSKYLGVGRDISIVSGIYERRQLILKVLNKQMQESEVYREQLVKIKKYELVAAIEEILDELEKKNICLEKAYHFDEVQEEQEIFEVMISVAKEVQAQSIKNNIRDNTVHLSNLMIYLTKLTDAIAENTNIKKQVQYLFVDEFQDTDDVQIQLISRFYQIFCFKLFVVGDTKQSIYRFRGAEDKAFDQLKQRISTGWTKKDLTLNKNYRSDKVLLNHFDELFTHWGQKNVLDYTNNGEESDELIGVKEDPTISEHIKCVVYEEDTFEQQLIKTIQERLHELDEKYKGTKKTGTVALLTRSKIQIEEIKKICQGKIKVETDFTENLYQLDPSKDLYYLILGIQFNTNPKYLYALSQTNFAKDIANRVVYQNRHFKNRIIDAFNEGNVVTNWSAHLTDMRKKPVLRVIREMIYEIQPWNNYAFKFAEEDQEDARKHYKMNLDLLIEDIVKECGEEYQTINTLERYLYIKIFANQHMDERSLDQEQSKHQVKCITVHKSKGLEYDHVILPYVYGEMSMIGKNKMIIKGDTIYTRLNPNPKLTLESVGFSKQVKEEKRDTIREEARILYVALTRAEDTVTWMKDKNFKEKSYQTSWKKLLGKEI